MRLMLEVEGEAMRPELPGGGDALMAFMSFAVSRGFGAQHPLIALADRLHDVHQVRLGPLTTFYEGEPADAEDRTKLEMVWQPAEDLRDAVRGLVEAIETDDQSRALVQRANAAGLHDQAAAMLPALNDAAAGGKRVRLSYTL